MKVLLISGPSGAGKSFLQNKLNQENSYRKLIPTTTRTQRIDEVDNEDYNFITLQEYEKLRKEDKFLTDYNIFDNHYCYRKDFLERIQIINKIPLIVIATRTIFDFVKIFPDSDLIYLLPKNLEILEQNMKRRKDLANEITKRLETSQNELKLWQKIKIKLKYTEIIIKNDQSLDEFIKEIKVVKLSEELQISENKITENWKNCKIY